jgi:hypothetical protein
MSLITPPGWVRREAYDSGIRYEIRGFGFYARVLVGELTSVDFVASARTHARQGQVGVIQRYSNSHGLCYEVLHEDDGTTAWYAPGELTELAEVQKKRFSRYDMLLCEDE